ncbi:MAG: hypothetical protein ACRDQH_08860, partial [Pseudonocardiaceae bacterium]
FSGAPSLAAGAPAILGQTFTAGERRSAVVVNVSASSITLTLPPQLRGLAATETVDAPAAFVGGGAKSTPAIRTAGAANTITLDPYSLTRLG